MCVCVCVCVRARARFLCFKHDISLNYLPILIRYKNHKTGGGRRHGFAAISDAFALTFPRTVPPRQSPGRTAGCVRREAVTDGHGAAAEHQVTGGGSRDRVVVVQVLGVHACDATYSTFKNKVI